MKRKVSFLITIVVLFCFANLNMIEIHAQTNVRNILYVASGSPSYVNTKELIKGFEQKTAEDYAVYYGYVNFDDMSSKEKENDLRNLIELDLKNYGKMDAVVFSGNLASRFAIDNSEIFNNIPLFFVNIDKNKTIKAVNDLGAKCIVEKSNLIRENVELIEKIYPNRKSIVLLKGPNKLNESTLESYNNLKQEYPKINFRIVSLNYENKDDVKKKISSINSKADVILFWNPMYLETGISTETASAKIEKLKEVMKEIKNYTKAPIYSNFGELINYGGLGGYVNDLTAEGYIVADSVDRYLNSPYNAPLIIRGDKTSKLFVNVNGARDTGASDKNLPIEAQKLYKTVFGLVKYSQVIHFLMWTVFILLLIVVFVIFKLRQKSNENKELEFDKKVAEDANEYKSNFISNMSHELKTPVTVIHSSTQLLGNLSSRSDFIDPEILRENLNIIEKNSSRLTRLINNILDVSKSESGFAKLQMKNIEIVSFIEDTVMSVSPYAEKKNLSILFDTEIEELIMAVDLDKIDRIILNLLSNAIKFSREGGEILTYLKSENEKLTIMVKDEGIGIKEEDFGFIFDKFAQVDNGFTRLTEGSGIGLSLVKEFAQLHDGVVRVESEVGVGTTFYVELPIKVIEDEDITYNVTHDEKMTASELSDIYL